MNEFDDVQFWSYLATGRLTSLVRTPSRGYEGELTDERSGEVIRLDLTNRQIALYDFGNDPRFAVGIYENLSAAIRAVISAPLFAQPSRPHITQLQLVSRLLGLPKSAVGLDKASYDSLLQNVLAKLSTHEITVDSALAVLEELKPSASEYQAYQQSGDLASLHNEREILLKAFAVCSSSELICSQIDSVISNASNEDHVTIGVAIWALGRQNYKPWIHRVIGLFEELDKAYHRQIELALQFLCSGERLLPFSDHPNKKNYWMAIAPTLPNDGSGWIRYDSRSVFWEKRLRVAHHLSGFSDSLDSLKGDEVTPVRVAVAQTTRMPPTEQIDYQAQPTTLASIVADERIIAGNRVSVIGDQTSFDEGLSSVIRFVAAKPKRFRGSDARHRLGCWQAARLVDYLASKVSGVGAKDFIWRVSEKTLMLADCRLQPDSVQELYDLSVDEKARADDVEDCLWKNSIPSGQSMPSDTSLRAKDYD